MEPDCPSLTISRFLAEEKIFLVGALDALRLCGNGEYEAMHPTQALWEFSWPGFRFDWQIRSFVAKTCLTLTPLSFLSDADILDIIKSSVQNRNLVALKKVAQVAGPADPTVEMRRLVRDLETKTRGKLNESGRAYKLVADVDLKRVPERDSYQVVAQDEGRKVLDALAKQPATAPDVADLLGQARDKLTRDWRQGFGEPDGLILLRRLPATRAPTPNTEPAITPSKLRELLGGWITVEVVDDFERPWRGKVKIELPSSTTRELAPDGQGSTTADGFEPGNAVVTLLDLHETSWDKG